MRNLIEERKSFESLGSIYPIETETKVERAVIAGVETHWFTPKHIDGDEVVIHLHGGGFIYGSIKSHRAMLSHIAKAIRRKILFIEYALAPEKPFPTALEETADIVQALSRSITGFQYGFMGDSCGGNLVMSAALYIKERGAQAPCYQIVISPWVNLNTTYSSYEQNAKLDPIITKEFIDYAAALYTDPKNFKNLFVSPTQGTFEGFAPTLILVGANEVLRDDSLHLHAALQNAGARSYLKIYPTANHVWMLTDIESSDTRDAFSSMNEFLGLFVSVR